MRWLKLAKSIVIQEDGTDKRFNSVKKLRTPLQGGGTCDWIPQSEMIAKTVTDRGVYQASADGVWGYTQVTVDMRNADEIQY